MVHTEHRSIKAVKLATVELGHAKKVTGIDAIVAAVPAAKAGILEGKCVGPPELS
jgi:hypothetical protein